MKYIDAGHLKVEIEKHIKKVMDAAARFTPNMGFFDAKLSGIYDVIAIIDSLQQEQLPGIEEHGIPGRDFVPVDWVDACEKYGKWKIVQQEQPDVDLEKIIGQTYHDGSVADTSDMDHVDYENIARHFYGLRNRALEEAARHVYESWMGGTMDDVRRDMVELGKVLNARKEEGK